MAAKTLLVVDDEPKITDVVKSYLEKSRYQTDCAHNGTDGLKMFDQYAPSLVILDLMLPDISGEETASTRAVNCLGLNGFVK